MQLRNLGSAKCIVYPTDPTALPALHVPVPLIRKYFCWPTCTGVQFLKKSEDAIGGGVVVETPLTPSLCSGGSGIFRGVDFGKPTRNKRVWANGRILCIYELGREHN